MCKNQVRVISIFLYFNIFCFYLIGGAHPVAQVDPELLGRRAVLQQCAE
jgi:hypothetical protein